MTERLKVDEISKSFGGVQATQEVSFSVREGEVLGIIGPNGAGKTTLFNLLTGIYRVDEGNILLDGCSIIGKSPREISRLGISRTFQNIRLFKELTVLENVMVPFEAEQGYNIFECMLHTGNFRKKQQQARNYAMELLEAVGIEEFAEKKPKELPYGHQRKLEIARALVLGKKVLLLDEPTSGMNPVETEQTLETIQKIRDRFHISILIIEHHMGVVMNLCTNILVLDFGKQIAYGKPESVKNDPAVIEAYLGREDD